MGDGQFLEDELYGYRDIRYTFSYGGEDDGLLVVEHLDRLRQIAAQRDAQSEWDKRLAEALDACTTALTTDVPGVVAWPGRPHPWTYPYINWPENEGDATTIYLSSFKVEYTDEYGFEQPLPDFACTYNIDDGTVKLTS